MKLVHIISLILILVFMIGLSQPTLVTYAQNEDQPLDDEFVEALVMMSVNHNMMEGKTEIRDLTALRDFVSDYYDDRYESTDGNMAMLYFSSRKNQLISLLDSEINRRSGLDLFKTVLMIFTDEKGLDIARDSMGIKGFVSGNGNPPGDYFESMNSLIMTDFEMQVNLLLDIDTISVQPDLTTLINDSSSWSLILPAILDLNSSITRAQTNQTQPDIGNGNSSPASDKDNGNIKKPVKFTNNGYEPVTVIIDTYQPAAGYDPAVPAASTVVFPDSNTTAYIELPLGTYTFCYEWQLDQDTNNDDYFDYHHRITSAISLSQSASSSPDSAISVALSPDSTVDNPNGKCGQDLPASNGTLTKEEAANAGTHGYVATCEGGEYCEGESIPFTFNIEFSLSGFTLTGEGENRTFTRVGENRYSWTDDDGENCILTFTLDGFSYYWSSEGVTIFYTMTDGSTEQSAAGDHTAAGMDDSGLIPELAANEGTHSYLCGVPGYGSYPDVMTITFSSGSGQIVSTNWTFLENRVDLVQVSENKYSYGYYGHTDSQVITFTTDGFSEWDTYENEVDIICQLQD